MNEPKRWLNDGASPVMERVLRAAGTEQPSADALNRALASAAAASGVAGVATSAGATGAASSGGVFLKWTLLACAVTVGGAGVAMSLTGGAGPRASAPPPISAPTGVSSAVPPPAPSDATAAPLASPAGAPARATRAARSGEAGTPRSSPAVPPDEVVEDADSLAQETELIERARAHSAARRAAAALAALDEYESRFTVRRYGPEALYLRMEALLALGQRDAARQVASRLATRYPNSPHAVRAESVRGSEKP